MPLAPMQFQITGDPMSQNLMAAIQRGMQLGYLPKEMQSQFAQQSASTAQQNALTNLDQTKIAAILNPSYKASSSFGKLQSDYDNAAQTYGADSTQAQQIGAALKNAMAPKNGITVYDQNGNPVVNVGGSGGRGGGNVTRDAQGNVVARPTQSQMTRLQKIASGGENLDQYFNEAINNIAQFQNPLTGGLEKGQEFSNKYFGTNYSLPSEKAYGEASLKTAAEGLLNNMGLNPSGENVQQMNDILTPKSGESTQGYQGRARKQLQEFAKTQLNAINKMYAGYQVGQGEPGGVQFNQTQMPSINNLPLTISDQQAASIPGAKTGFIETENQTGSQKMPVPSLSDIQFTAQKYGLTVDQVKQRLGI